MSLVNVIEPATATGESRELLETVRKALGVTPNLAKVLANSPASLNGYLQFSGSLARAGIGRELAEEIALAVAEVNGCEYCLAAHNLIGGKVGLSESARENARRGSSEDSTKAAALRFSQSLVEKRGRVLPEEVEELRAVGFTDGQIVEIVSHVALNLFTNYVNIALDTEIDFPPAPKLTAMV